MFFFEFFLEEVDPFFLECVVYVRVFFFEEVEEDVEFEHIYLGEFCESSLDEDVVDAVLVYASVALSAYFYDVVGEGFVHLEFTAE